MTVAQSTGVFIGTDETTGVTVANNTTTTSSEIDLLGGTTFLGEANLFLKYTSTVTAGTIEVTLYPSRVTGQAYADVAPQVLIIPPINGTQKVYIARFPVGRYMNATVKNNATGASATNVTLGYELFKLS